MAERGLCEEQLIGYLDVIGSSRSQVELSSPQILIVHRSRSLGWRKRAIAALGLPFTRASLHFTVLRFARSNQQTIYALISCHLPSQKHLFRPYVPPPPLLRRPTTADCTIGTEAVDLAEQIEAHFAFHQTLCRRARSSLDHMCSGSNLMMTMMPSPHLSAPPST